MSGTTPRHPNFNTATNSLIPGATFDNAGHVTEVESYSLGYDAENRQTIAVDNVSEGQASYAYDGLGQRVTKSNNGLVSTLYVSLALYPLTVVCFLCPLFVAVSTATQAARGVGLSALVIAADLVLGLLLCIRPPIPWEVTTTGSHLRDLGYWGMAFYCVLPYVGLFSPWW
ncbi:MAG: hypothetical protein ACR2JB_07535 [Bryobacteraceae bacterium]